MPTPAVESAHGGTAVYACMHTPAVEGAHGGAGDVVPAAIPSPAEGFGCRI